jgi:16S rRNA G966 N2-methylase RsmD
MRKYHFLILFAFFISFAKQTTASNHLIDQSTDSLLLPNADSTEYDIIIFDPGFKSWMITHAQPMGYHTNEYYRNKNIILVAEWNSRVRTNNYRAPYEYEIEFSPHVDYGMDVNYQLYWYFRYMEQKFGFNLFGPGAW